MGSTESEISRIFKYTVYTVVVILLVVIFLPFFISVIPPGITVSSATKYLESRGYWVLAAGECYPGDFLPCTGNAQSLGNDGNRWKDLWLSSPTIYLGTVTISNTGSQIDIDGQLVLHDGGKVWLEIQPDLDYSTVVATGKPTQVYRGASSGFSLPIYNDDNEELFTSMDVRREWDGITNPVLHIHCYIPDSSNGYWILPNSFIDYGIWTDETLAYDNDKKTFAYNSIAGTSWSGFLEFEIDEALYDKVRFYAKYDVDNINTVDIDAYYNSAWNDVYQDAYESMAWISKSLGNAYSVSKYRIRFYNAGVNPKDAKLYETALCSVAGQGNFNLELGWNNYTPGDNDSVSDNVNLGTVETTTVIGSYKSYVASIELSAIDLTTCDQLDLRLRRIEASENEIAVEVIVTHIGVQFLRDKLGEITP